jgi:hypothetical protein
VLSSNGQSASYAPEGLSRHQTGDLRLSYVWDDQSYTIDLTTGTRTQLQYLDKYLTRNVHIYRRQMVYLKLAEALNWAGQPRLAYKILESGLTPTVIKAQVNPYLNESDSIWVANNLPLNTDYVAYKAEDMVGLGAGRPNTIGIHSRGSGFTPMNEFYRLVNDTLETDPVKYEQLKAEQQVFVDSLIINESALELAFEGTRYYDLMRYAMRQPNPGAAMEHFILARRGEQNRDAVRGDIKKSLLQQANWYLDWNGHLGLNAQ